MLVSGARGSMLSCAAVNGEAISPGSGATDFMPLRHAVTLHSVNASRKHQQRAPSAPRRGAPMLDGGRSPFAGEPPLRLPAIAVSRSKMMPEEVFPGMTPSSSGRRSAPAAAQAGKESPIEMLFEPPMSAPAAEDGSSNRKRRSRLRCEGGYGFVDGLPLAAADKVLWTPKAANLTPHSCPHLRSRRPDRTKTCSSITCDDSTPTLVSPTLSSDAGLSLLMRTSSTPSPCPSSTPAFQPSSRETPESQAPLPNPCAGKWQRGAKIGLGSYGSVYKALDRETGRIFAVKKQVLEENGDEEDQRFRDKLQDEITIYKELRHPHIVSYLGHECTDGTLNIYLEYVAGGSMSNILSEFGPLDDALLRTSALGLLEGLNYLHTREVPVVHRDIKGANILVDLSFCVKLADFGCSKRCSNTRSFTTVGSIPWMAPEVIQQQDGHGRKADIWSLGCTIIEMATADKPWGRDTFDNIVFAMKHIGLSDNVPPIPDNISESARDLIAVCVQRCPDHRPCASQLLEHNFVTKAAAVNKRKSTKQRQRSGTR